MPKKLQFTGQLQGPKGIDGKTAYQNAVEGGYTGTEEEFSSKLAQDNPTRSEFNQLANTKADKTTVDTELAKKADKTTVNTELAKKADKTTVETSLNTKANKTDVDSALNTKADKTTVDSLSSTKADKTTVESIQTSLTENTRKTEALWQFHQGVTHWFEEDSASVYQRDVPSGAKMANLKQVGGKTIVWNQMVNMNNYACYSSEASITKTDNEITVTQTVDNVSYNYSSGVRCGPNNSFHAGHKYLLMCDVYVTCECSCLFEIMNNYPDNTSIMEANRWNNIMFFITGKDTKKNPFVYLTLKDRYAKGDVYKIKNWMIFDLTLMFGAGNEPETVEEFEAVFPEDYYEYNEGTLRSMPCNEVVEQGKNLFNYEKRDEYTGYNFISGNTLIESSQYPNVRVYRFDVKAGEEYTYYINILGNTTCAFGIGNSIDNLLSVSDSRVSESKMFTVAVPDGYDKMYLCISVDNAESLFIAKGKYSEIYPYHQTSHPIPQSILDLDGYGDSVSDNVYNYVDYDRKQYVKRVGKLVITDDIINYAYKYVDYYYLPISNANFKMKHAGMAINNVGWKYLYTYEGNSFFFDSDSIIVGCELAANWATLEDYKSYLTSLLNAGNPLTFYYELDEPVITDISDLLISAVPFDVEPGGTLTFKNPNGDGFRVPIPNTVEYAVKLEEVLV